jgi:hypothetical protein
MELIKRALASIEPWYDWGGIFFWERLDGRGEDNAACHFELEWLGLKMLIVVGRTPAIDSDRPSL